MIRPLEDLLPSAATDPRSAMPRTRPVAPRVLVRICTMLRLPLGQQNSVREDPQEGLTGGREDGTVRRLSSRPYDGLTDGLTSAL